MPKATPGPIPNANMSVPSPTVPPKYQPNITADISIVALIEAIGKRVFFVKYINYLNIYIHFRTKNFGVVNNPKI